MSRRKSGNWFQNVCQKKLEEEGYVVHNQKPGARYERNRDIFGADLVALRLGWKPRFIQSSQGTNILSRLRKYLSYPFPQEHTQVELWTLAQDKKRVTMRKLVDDTFVIVGEFNLEEGKCTTA